MASISDPDDEVSELGNQYDNKLLADISTDEHMADVPQDEDEARRRARRAKMPSVPSAGVMQKPAHDIAPLATSTTTSLQSPTASTLPPSGTSLKPQSCSSDYPRT